MTDVLCVSTIPHRNGLSRDSVKNSFVFATNTDDAAGWQAAADAVVDFFTAPRAPGVSVGAEIAHSMSRVANACSVQVYDITDNLDGSPHGSPIYLRTWTLPVGNGNTSLPGEVAACLSFQGFQGVNAPVEGTEAELPTPASAIRMGAPATHVGRIRPKSRTRGRIFIGPLQSGVSQVDAGTGRAKLTAQFMQELSDAGKALMDLAAAEWCQWSRAERRIQTVTDAWVDDAFDTQRRRGEKNVVRTSVVTADAGQYIHDAP